MKKLLESQWTFPGYTPLTHHAMRQAGPPKLMLLTLPVLTCLAVHANGAVFVGVDKIGSLGKTPGKGSIIKLIDSNNDGKVDSHTEFALVDNPRGIIAMGDQVCVLYTHF